LPGDAKTVLLINQLGAGFGHVSALLPIGAALAGRGHSIVCSMADMLHASLSLRRVGFPVVQAPVWPGRRSDEPSSYADLLVLNGFESVPALMLMVQAWQDLFDIIAPDLIVADHSPTAALAAYGSIPTVLVGNGFAMPPHDLPGFPILQPGRDALAPEARLLEAVCEVQDRRGRPAPPSLPGLFAAEFRAVLTLPELDPYDSQRNEQVLGPMGQLPPYRPSPPSRSVYAYLATDHPEIEEIAAGLALADADISCHVRGDNGRIAEFLAARGVAVLEEPADLANTLPSCAAVVSHGSLGMAHAALAAGRPQLTLPHDLEKRSAAAALDGLGVSSTIIDNVDASTVAAQIDRLISDSEYGHRASVCAQSILARPSADALGTVVDACEDLLG